MRTVCGECGRVIEGTRELYRERMEYASYNGRERRATWTVRLVCRGCVDNLKRAHDHALPPDAQRSLL